MPVIKSVWDRDAYEFLRREYDVWSADVEINYSDSTPSVTLRMSTAGLSKLLRDVFPLHDYPKDEEKYVPIMSYSFDELMNSDKKTE